MPEVRKQDKESIASKKLVKRKYCKEETRVNQTNYQTLEIGGNNTVRNGNKFNVGRKNNNNNKKCVMENELV